MLQTLKWLVFYSAIGITWFLYDNGNDLFETGKADSKQLMQKVQIGFRNGMADMATGKPLGTQSSVIENNTYQDISCSQLAARGERISSTQEGNYRLASPSGVVCRND